MSQLKTYVCLESYRFHDITEGDLYVESRNNFITNDNGRDLKVVGGCDLTLEHLQEIE